MKDFLTPPLTGAKLKQSALLLISSFLRETDISHEAWSIEFEQTLRDSEGQGSMACCRPWGHKESEATGQLNNNGPLRFPPKAKPQ